ncbi:MmgE/PrpD family protein [Shimia sp. FJ5]|uniref:MmgE/PrpD family protein n=1 Tax=Shimia sp. FJ5 TaxID=3079054 RepID=UPI00261E0B7D|nr:MmgE/PrpD family protein [Shimia sp. FJ5]MDV4143893.1 MmgE/PrpD family protein [Shimia sp. FJ5]
MHDPIAFLHDLTWETLPETVRAQVPLHLLDLFGIGAAGMRTNMSRIIRDHAYEDFGGEMPLLYDGRGASPLGAALAAGITIDSIDGHDGFNPSKGHIGAPMIPAALYAAHEAGATGRDFLTAVVVGYEIGARAAIAQHATAPDYHTSGSWGAVAAAAVASRIMQLSPHQTRHALGIAEYHGPRSQMMRCIDHPTMVKDGAGWGSMAGISAARLAAKGFTGAPALIVEEVTEPWADLGTRWYMLEQYFKPYPVCRWAQPPIEAALALQRAHNIAAADITKIEVETFHESIRLATSHPKRGDEAQYSTSFPTAVALVHGDVRPEHLVDAALSDPEVLRLSAAMIMRESDHANDAFPLRRFARATLTLADGTTHQSDWHEPRWDATALPSPAEIRSKFHAYADPVLGRDRATALETAIDALPETGLAPLTDQLFRPINS